jgi:hypothetical protein
MSDIRQELLDPSKISTASNPPELEKVVTPKLEKSKTSKKSEVKEIGRETTKKSDNIFVEITPDSFMAKHPNFKFRIGFKENEVTQFSPYSKEFHSSIKNSVLQFIPVAPRYTSDYDNGLPLFLKTKNMSTGLSSVGNIMHMDSLEHGFGGGFKEVSKGTPGIDNDKYVHYSPNGSFYELKLANLKDKLSSKSFSEYINIFKRICISSEELAADVKGFLRTFKCNFQVNGYHYKDILTASAATEHTSCIRLINIYEAIPDKAYCFSFLAYMNRDPERARLFHLWLNEYTYEQKVETISLCPFYASHMISYTLANLLMPQIGIQIDPLGFSRINMVVDGKEISFSSVSALTVLEDLFSMKLTTRRHNGYATEAVAFGAENNFSFEGIGLTNLSTLRGRARGYFTENSNFNSQPNLLKTLGSLVKRGNYGSFLNDPVKLKNKVLTAIYDGIKNGNDNDFISPFRKILNSTTMHQTWSEILRTRQDQLIDGKLKVSSENLQDLLGRPGFANKLVFAST